MANRRLHAWWWAVTLVACARSTVPTGSTPAPRAAEPVQAVPPANAAVANTPPPAPVRPLPPLRRPAPARLVAIGDIHGDLEALRAALRLGGAIDGQDHWIGGPLVVVQTGDLLDRGDQERAILTLVARLRDDAAAAGGAFIALNGNHEIMNVAGDFRYVTPAGYADFAAFAELAAQHPELSALPRAARPRMAAFMPGGPMARQLAEMNTVTVVGDTVFVHGGLRPAHVEHGLQRINDSVREFMLSGRTLPGILQGEDSPVWDRRFALQGDADTCAMLDATLRQIPARRLVIGHTVQEQGINSACSDRVWRIDVGLARYYHGPTEVLEIAGERVRALRSAAPTANPGAAVH